MRVLLAFALVCCIAMPSFADLIDQDQPSGPDLIITFWAYNLAQSFQQTNDNISGAGLLMWPGYGTTDIITIALWDALPNDGGTELVSASAIATEGEWVDVYWDYYSVTPGTTYYLVFSATIHDEDYMAVAGDVNDPYPYGNIFVGPDWGAFPEFDFAFRTYYNETTATENGTVSEIKVLYR